MNHLETEDSSIAENMETAFVNQYAYLHTEPDKDARKYCVHVT